jgi:hypothetical protein
MTRRSQPEDFTGITLLRTRPMAALALAATADGLQRVHSLRHRHPGRNPR